MGMITMIPMYMYMHKSGCAYGGSMTMSMSLVICDL